MCRHLEIGPILNASTGRVVQNCGQYQKLPADTIIHVSTGEIHALLEVNLSVVIRRGGGFTAKPWLAAAERLWWHEFLRVHSFSQTSTYKNKLRMDMNDWEGESKKVNKWTWLGLSVIKSKGKAEGMEADVSCFYVGRRGVTSAS